jgi:hypothetical protein
MINLYHAHDHRPRYKRQTLKRWSPGYVAVYRSTPVTSEVSIVAWNRTREVKHRYLDACHNKHAAELSHVIALE